MYACLFPLLWLRGPGGWDQAMSEAGSGAWPGDGAQEHAPGLRDLLGWCSGGPRGVRGGYGTCLQFQCSKGSLEGGALGGPNPPSMTPCCGVCLRVGVGAQCRQLRALGRRLPALSPTLEAAPDFGCMALAAQPGCHQAGRGAGDPCDRSGSLFPGLGSWDLLEAAESGHPHPNQQGSSSPGPSGPRTSLSPWGAGPNPPARVLVKHQARGLHAQKPPLSELLRLWELGLGVRDGLRERLRVPRLRLL